MEQQIIKEPIVGIHYDMPAAKYHERVLGEISKSGIDQARRSMAHYRAWATGALEEEQTAAMRFGTAVHASILEPSRYAKEYGVPPNFGDCRKAANKEARDLWRAALPEDFIELNQVEADAVSRIREAIWAHADASKLLSEAVFEVTLRWLDPDTKLACKARADAWIEAERIAIDLKTATDLSNESIRASCARFGYHRQAAFYRLGFAANEKPLKNFLFIFVEKTIPHAVRVIELNDDAIVKGYRQCRTAIDDIHDSLTKNVWPAYEAGIFEIDLPTWA